MYIHNVIISIIDLSIIAIYHEVFNIIIIAVASSPGLSQPAFQCCMLNKMRGDTIREKSGLAVGSTSIS